MRTFAALSLVVAASSFGVVVAGCGGSDSSDPFGPEPDYASVQQRIQSPTGTVSERNLSAVLSRYSEQRDTSALGNVGLGTSTSTSSGTGTGTTTTHSQALHILGGSSGLTASCAALAQGNATGSCACPSGGSFAYDFSALRYVQSSGLIDASMKVRFDACRTHDVNLDGREFVHVHGNHSGSSADFGSLDVVLVADFVVSKGAETHTIDLAAMVHNGAMEIAVAVDDGWVTISANTSNTGAFVVRDRNGSWTCTVTDGAGTCHDESGNTKTF
jgi:hypothetical protein